jgi:predicted metal-dependent phosphoesterase TrpH
VIDLHLHTTASDGHCTPEELVQRAWNVGIRTISVTDHDTMAAVAPATQAAAALGMTVVPGIEITSVHNGKDVHVLAYFLSPSTSGLQEMLATQRRLRLERAREIADRLSRLGAPIDVRALAEASTTGGKSLARPQIAQALITAGHVASVSEAFEKYLGENGPAYVPHHGASPAEVIALVAAGGGIASLAHPGYRPRDEIIPSLVEAGLTALEAYHSSHDSTAEAHYLALALGHRLLVTGGSDYHGEGTRRAESFGLVGLPAIHFESLRSRAGRHSEKTLGAVQATEWVGTLGGAGLGTGATDV